MKKYFYFSDMLILQNWLKKYIDFNLTPTELSETLTMLGIEVESYKDLKTIYEGFYVGEVLTKEKHPNADKLSLCKVSIGNKELSIICGAPNVAAGQKVIVGIIGATVPSAGFKLEKRKIRDYYSEGMICSQAELNLGEDQSGIWVLPNDAPVGKTIIEYLQLDDLVLEISLTPNKPDCISHIGVARELAAVLKQKITLPKIKLEESKKEKTSKYISVNVANNELCPRYTTRIIKNIKNVESPEFLKNALINVGIRPRNVVVDVTNYVLFGYGQPLHAFDYDKITGQELEIKNGFTKKFITLDGKERQLDKDMLMICDAEKPIAIAGVMGGKNTEITDDTTNVILESAFFNPSSIRRTSKKLALQTDASYRFERGADIDICKYAIDVAADLIKEFAGGDICSGIVEVYPNPVEPKEIEFRFDKARDIIGIDISNNCMADILKYLGFKLSKASIAKAKSIIVIVPNRRIDITDEIDLIEEIARVFNYNNIAPNFASVVSFQHDELPQYLKPLPLRNNIRNYLVHSGFTEILTQNIIDPASAELTHSKIIRIENPLGEEMSIMRPSMLTSILRTISFNIRQGNQNLKLFETGKIFLPQNNITNSFIEGIDEREQFVIAMTGNVNPRQWGVPDRKVDFFDLKGSVVELLNHIRIPKRKTNPISNNNLNLYRVSLHSNGDGVNGHSNIFDENGAELFSNKTSIGIMGNINKSILEKYDIDFPVFIAIIDLTTIAEIDIPQPYYSVVSPYPMVKRDLAFIVNESISAKEIKKTIIDNSTKLLKSVNVFDVYSGKNIEQGKHSIGFELNFSSNDKTLTDAEVENEINPIIKSIEKNFNGELRK